MEIWLEDVIQIVYVVKTGKWHLAKFTMGDGLIVDRKFPYDTFEEARERLETTGERLRRGWAR